MQKICEWATSPKKNNCKQGEKKEGYSHQKMLLLRERELYWCMNACI